MMCACRAYALCIITAAFPRRVYIIRIPRPRHPHKSRVDDNVAPSCVTVTRAARRRAVQATILRIRCTA